MLPILRPTLKHDLRHMKKLVMLSQWRFCDWIINWLHFIRLLLNIVSLVQPIDAMLIMNLASRILKIFLFQPNIKFHCVVLLFRLLMHDFHTDDSVTNYHSLNENEYTTKLPCSSQRFFFKSRNLLQCSLRSFGHLNQDCIYTPKTSFDRPLISLLDGLISSDNAHNDSDCFPDPYFILN